jgi:hypothetical protein
MSDSTAKKIKKVITLPTILKTASISHVFLEQAIDKVSHEASHIGGKPLMTTKSVFSDDFQMLKVDQLCMLCSMRKLKKYGSAPRDETCLLMTQNQLLFVVDAAQDMKVKAQKEEFQASKLCLLSLPCSPTTFLMMLSRWMTKDMTMS